MAITDPAGTNYIQNMYLTNPTSSAKTTHTSTQQTTSQTGTQNTSSAQTTTQNEAAKNFATLLQTVMTNKAISSISDFSGSNSNNSTGSSSDLFSGLSGLSALSGLSGLSSLSGLAGLSDLTALSSLSGQNALSGLSGLSALAGSADSLLGTGASDADSSYMSLLLLSLMLASQNKDGKNNNLLNALTGNTSAAAAQTEHTTQQAQVSNASQSSSGTVCKHMLAKLTGSQSQNGIPSNSWIVSKPALTNLTGQRNAALYSAVINQFNVEDNERYRVNKQGIGDTYCNIYTWDVTRAMGAEIPHYIVEATGEPVSEGGEGIQEMTANLINDWLHKYGEKYGWTQVTAEEAQQYANNGSPAITSWKNPNGHGHLQVVCPSADGTYNAERGVTISQAGRYLKQYDYIDSVYGETGLQNVEYFVHK